MHSPFRDTGRSAFFALLFPLASAAADVSVTNKVAAAPSSAASNVPTVLLSWLHTLLSPSVIMGAVIVLLLVAVFGSVFHKKSRRRAARRKELEAKVEQRKQQRLTRSQKRAETELTNHYRALFENANDLILGMGLDGKLLYANTAWQENLDYNEHAMQLLSIFEVLSPDSLESFKQSFERASFGVKIKNLEMTFVSKYGKKLMVEGSLHCQLQDDRPASIQGIFRDITERKRSEMALKQSEQRFSRVFAASPIAIAICTLEAGRIEDVNERFLKMLGYDRHDTVGRTDVKLGFWANPEDREQIVQKVLEQESVRDRQCKLRTTTGDIREALVSAELIEVNNEPCLLLIIHDNTERLNLESQLRQAQKMEGIGQLAAGIAHDFNNILTIIQGHASRLHNLEGLPERTKDSVAQVSVAADRAATLTRQLLTFCRKQAMLAEEMDLNETVAHVSAMLERILGEDIALEFKGAKSLPLISADSAMLELILINLACNSRDAMPKGGTLRIATSSIEINAAYVQQRPEARAGQHVCLIVTDTGCGMRPETLRRVFEPFFTTKEVGKGTGLGLATVYGIVDQHHGWIEVTSEVGVGTTFKIYLPQVERPQGNSVERPATPVIEEVSDAQCGHETILLVEDEMALRELARIVLEDYNYRILEAGSGVQALKVWEEHKEEIDMLLTDMVMPEGMTGRDLAEKLQAEKPKLKVLYSSGYSPDVVGGYFKLPENSRFLAKPYQPPILAQAVRECLDNVTKKSEQKIPQPA
jgi:PAS domain S-box-containing protein